MDKWDTTKIGELAELAIRTHDDMTGQQWRELNAAPWQMRVRAMSTLYEATLSPAYLMRLAQLIDHEDGELWEKAAILFYVQRQVQLGRLFNPVDFQRSYVWPAYRALLVGLEPKGLPAPHGDRRLVVVSPQVLAPSHAPTQNALEYCLGAVAEGYEVLLIDAELFPVQPFTALYAPFVANRMGHLDGHTSYLHDGLAIPFYRPGPMPLSEAKLGRVFERVKAFNPSVVLSLGGYNIAGDALSELYPTVHVPTTSGLAATLADVALMGPNEGHNGFVSRLQYVTQRSVAVHFNAEAKDADATTITEPGFRFVIVGNRLAAEMDDRFVTVLSKLLEWYPLSMVTVIGHDGERVAQRFEDLAHRFLCLGHVDNVPKALAASTVYLNPFRTGGGLSGYMAQRVGLPVITLDTGDVATYVANGPGTTATDPKRYLELAASVGANLYARHKLLRAQGEALRPELRDGWEDTQTAIDLARERHA